MNSWQEEGKYFVCRIKSNTQKTIVYKFPIPEKSNILFFAEVYLGDEQHRTRNTVRLVGYKVGRKLFWVATNRKDLTALEIATIYRPPYQRGPGGCPRWEIEKFFAWWKRHLNVYHLIARSPYGLMMQLLSGLITYLLIVIYFYWRYNEFPSLLRLRQLRRDIRRERALHSVMSHSITSTRSITLYDYTKRKLEKPKCYYCNFLTGHPTLSRCEVPKMEYDHQPQSGRGNEKSDGILKRNRRSSVPKSVKEQPSGNCVTPASVEN